MILKGTVLNKRNESQKVIYCVIPTPMTFMKTENYTDEDRLVAAKG